MIKDYMEKKGKVSGSRPNASNGSLHRHAHMSSSAAAVGVHGLHGNPNLRQQDDHHQGRSIRRSRSFCGRPFQTEKVGEASSSSSKLKKNAATMMRRPKTHPELLNRDDRPVLMKNNKMNPPLEALSANKLLVSVTVAQSIGPLRLLLSKDATVENVIKAALVLYAKEGRKPLLSSDPTSFGLHYSQFSIDCLNPTDKIKDLGSRNFFLCSKEKAKENCILSFQRGETVVSERLCLSPSSCGKDVQNISRTTQPWYKQLIQNFLMDWDFLVQKL